MGTTIAGNQHIGTNYLKNNYIWKQGLGGKTADVELYEEDYIFVYEFFPPYDQRDDGELAIEFYYYYRKPTTSDFWNYCYDPDYFYILPFIASSNDDPRYEPVGKWWGMINYNYDKISLVGRESGWIHVTLYVDEYIWGRYTENGQTYENPLYFGLYSPIPVFVWDNSVSGGIPVTPYDILWDYSEFEDDDVYDVLTGGYLEDCYVSRRQINDYPSFYITYHDVTPDNFNYAVNEAAVINVSSAVNRKSVLKKLLSEIKAVTGTTGRHQLHIRNAGNHRLGVSDSFAKRMYFARLLSERKSMATLLSRKHFMTRQFNDAFEPVALKDYQRLLFRSGDDALVPAASIRKTLSWKRLLEIEPEIETEVIRKQVAFRNNLDEVQLAALPFASRLFFRAVETVMGFWDWLRGKIREANNVVTLFCPISTEIELECRI